MTSTNERDSHFFLAGWNGAWRNVNASEHFQNVSKTAPAPVAVRDALAGVSAPAAQVEEIQWRNIKKVVDALADLCFGSVNDPKWGIAHIAIRHSLVSKDGLDIKALGLEPLATAPQAQAYARDAEQDRWMEIGKAIERACIDLPDSTEIVISLERDAGTVTMFDPDGNEHDQFSHEDGFAGVVNAAIEAASAAAKEQG